MTRKMQTDGQVAFQLKVVDIIYLVFTSTCSMILIKAYHTIDAHAYMYNILYSQHLPPLQQ